ncbi:MAG: hypothetical protein JWN84_1497 [Nocardioides sp.]|nr:hypothetical protein [Nocardioides sp.]
MLGSFGRQQEAAALRAWLATDDPGERPMTVQHLGFVPRQRTVPTPDPRARQLVVLALAVGQNPVLLMVLVDAALSHVGTVRLGRDDAQGWAQEHGLAFRQFPLLCGRGAVEDVWPGSASTWPYRPWLVGLAVSAILFGTLLAVVALVALLGG